MTLAWQVDGLLIQVRAKLLKASTSSSLSLTGMVWFYGSTAELCLLVLFLLDQLPHPPNQHHQAFDSG